MAHSSAFSRPFERPEPADAIGLHRDSTIVLIGAQGDLPENGAGYRLFMGKMKSTGIQVIQQQLRIGAYGPVMDVRLVFVTESIWTAGCERDMTVMSIAQTRRLVQEVEVQALAFDSLGIPHPQLCLPLDQDELDIIDRAYPGILKRITTIRRDWGIANAVLVPLYRAEILESRWKKPHFLPTPNRKARVPVMEMPDTPTSEPEDSPVTPSCSSHSVATDSERASSGSSASATLADLLAAALASPNGDIITAQVEHGAAGHTYVTFAGAVIAVTPPALLSDKIKRYFDLSLTGAEKLDVEYHPDFTSVGTPFDLDGSASPPKSPLAKCSILDTHEFLRGRTVSIERKRAASHPV